MHRVVILGSGITGLSAAYHLGESATVYESESTPGGLCRSEKFDKFTFDLCGHGLHIKSEDTKRTLLGFLDGNLLTHCRKAGIYMCGQIIDYPFQANFFTLPKSIVRECALGLLEAIVNTHPRGENSPHPSGSFEEWIVANFGFGIAKHFMLPYNTKIWTVPPRDMVATQVSRFVPLPTLGHIVDGLLGLSLRPVGYNTVFYYPARGGMQSLINALIGKLRRSPVLGCAATRIDLEDQTVEFEDRTRAVYDALVSTVPLPKLARLVAHPTRELASLVSRLRYNHIVTTHLCIRRPEICNYHWLYFPEPELIFYRAFFPSILSDTLVPSGCSSITLEVALPQDSMPNMSAIEGRVVADLISTGLIRSESEISGMISRFIPYGYPIHLPDSRMVVDGIIDSLRTHNLYCAGRFGAWQYFSIEDCWKHGESVARTIRDNTGLAHADR